MNMTNLKWIKFKYRFLRRQGHGRILAGIKAVVETFAPLPF